MSVADDRCGGKGDGAADPACLFAVWGTGRSADFTSAITWLPQFNGAPDQSRLTWLERLERRLGNVALQQFSAWLPASAWQQPGPDALDQGTGSQRESVALRSGSV